MNYLSHQYLRWVAIFFIATLASGCSRSARISRYFERAEQDFKGGAYDSAKISYMKVLQADPHNAVAFARLGQIWLEEGAPIRAGGFLKKAQELAPGDIENRVRLAKFYRILDAEADARRELLTALAQAPGCGSALVSLTELARTPEEVATAKKALDKYPAKDSAFYHLSEANLLSQADPAAAQESLKKAVAADPKSPEAHQALALVQMLHKNNQAAEDELRTAADLAPPRSDIRLRFAEYLRQAGKIEAATSYLKGLTAKTPDFIAAWSALSQIALSEKKYDTALTYLGNVLSRDPRSLDGRLLQSDIRLAQNQPEQAIAELEKLDVGYSALPAVKYRMAQAFMQQKKTDQAAAALDQALAKDPNFTEAILARAELNIRTGHPDRAIDPLQDLIKEQSALRPAKVLLADAYRSVGRLDEAAKLFQAQISTASKPAETYFNLGLTQVQQHKFEEARQSFEKAAELQPDSILPIEQLVNLDLKDKDFESAMRRVQQHLDRKPKSAPAYFLQGKIFAAKPDWERAEQALQKAIQLDDKFSTAYQLLISTYLAQNKIPQALAQLRDLIARNPKDSRARLLLASIFEKQQDYPKARDEYEKLLAITPDFFPALNNLAYLYAEPLNDINKAYELAQKANNLRPKDPSVADTLGWVLYKRGDYQQALTQLQESAKNLPDNPTVQYHLGMALYMMGQLDAARPALERATRTTADFPGKDEARRRLALLDKAASGDARLGATQLHALLNQHPGDLALTVRLGEALEREGQAAKAAEVYEEALRTNPDLAGPVLRLAKLYVGPLNDREKAITYARKAVDLSSSSDPVTTATVGEIARKAGNFSWAYNLLKDSSRTNPDNPTVLYNLAMATYALGKVPDARQTMERCLAANPDASIRKEAERFLAMTGLERPSPEAIAAALQVQDILKENPNDVSALMVGAAIQIQRGETAQAVDTYSRILLQYPDFAPAQKRLSAIYAERPDDLDKAYDLASKAQRTLRGDPELTRTLARLSYRRKQFSQAIQLFEQSAIAQPLPAQDLYYLGIAELEIKQYEKGREALNRALKAGLTGPSSDDAIRKLAGEKTE